MFVMMPPLIAPVAVRDAEAIAPDVVMLPTLFKPVGVRDDALIAPVLIDATLTVPSVKLFATIIARTAVMLLALNEDKAVMVGCFRAGYIINLSLVVYVRREEIATNT